jgi:aminopeptidase
MRDPRHVKLADLLVNYSAAIKPDDTVLIYGTTLTEPLTKEVYVKVLEAGGHPLLYTDLPDWKELFFKNASDTQLAHVNDLYLYALSNCDAMIRILGEANTRNLSNVDPRKAALYQQAYGQAQRVYLERAARGDLRWSLTLYPTEAHAQDAEMSLSEYEDFVYKACMPDMSNPIEYWKNVSAQQARIIDWLKGKNKVHVTGPNTDLTLSIADRIFVNSDCHNNVPDGEVFTGPVEESIEGYVEYSFPAIYQGHEVTGVRLWFEKGKVVKAEADKGEDYLLSVLDTDEGSRYVGEFAIGTNEGIDRFTGQILFDEKIGGSFHMAVGTSYPQTGGKNKSSVHWDMICDLRKDSEITVDGELFYRDGKFMV